MQDVLTSGSPPTGANDVPAPVTSFPKSKIRVLLCEGVHKGAADRLGDEFSVEYHAKALSPDELKAKIATAHIIGIRSRTQLTAEVLSHAKRLLAIGCFCIGTNQVDLQAAAKLGIPVFNSPFCNSRSVAELVIAQVIALSRRLGDANMMMHSGKWFKSSKGCREVRGRTIGIVGYGHIGSQLSVLAESLGMTVIFYDIIPKLPLGNARGVASLSELLSKADFVTLHVPETPETKHMIAAEQIALMQPGSFLLNASRGTVVVLEDMAAALKSGHLAGAYVDVYPSEPSTRDSPFECVLQGIPNVLMTPHIGGSTEEAQASIGAEVAQKLIQLVNEGNTATAVNFPQVSCRPEAGAHRILNVHHNVPGVLRAVNAIVDDNVRCQILGTTPDIGYLLIDVDKAVSGDIKDRIKALKTSIKTRILF